MDKTKDSKTDFPFNQLVEDWFGITNSIGAGNSQNSNIKCKEDFTTSNLKDEYSSLLTNNDQRKLIKSSHNPIRGFMIDKESISRLQQLSDNQGTTLNTTMLSVLNVLLHRYSNQNDILVRCVTVDSLQGEVAFNYTFSKIVAVQNRICSTTTFTELLLDLNGNLKLAFDKELFIELNKNTVNNETDLSCCHHLNILFLWQNKPGVSEAPIEIKKVSSQNNRNELTQFDLTFAFTETDQGLDGVVEYRTDLFKEATIERMIGHFKQLVTAVVAAPQQSIGTLPLLTPKEEHQLLVEFNNTAVAYPQDKTVVHLFEEQVTKTPDNIAVVYNQQKLTYRELNQKANQVAYELMQMGVGVGDYIPLLLPEGIDYLVSFIASLKTGAVCVPLSIEWPHERIELILNELNFPIVITEENLDAPSISLKDNHRLYRLNYLNKDSVYSNINSSSFNGIMCIFYTSGSTGIPKGVEVNHKGIANRFFWMNDYFKSPLKNILKTTRNIFDSSIWQLLWPLVNGGKTVLGVEAQSYDFKQIIELIFLHQITVIDFSPSLFQLFVEETSRMDKTYDISCLQDIIIGGEAIRVLDVNRFKTNYPIIRITNLYGPTEASIGCVYFSIKLNNNTSIPIGTPISNTQIYILDEQQQAVPIGIAGELYIGGAGLARGYLNRPELTREKFLPHPFSTDATERLYRTGDRGRWLEDGTIEYLGRLDDQVKIRGYRIEPGEIEGVLLQSGLVKEAVVVVQDQGSGNKQLVGYYVAGAGVDKSSLVSWLHARLPAYMVPALWVQLPRMPLTPNGKVDKKALPAPVQALSGNYEAPASDTEKALAQIWQEVLHLEQVGLHDNFFELGGHSLIVLQLANRIRNMGVPIELKDLFAHQTIEKLATFIQHNGNNVLLPSLLTMQSKPRLIPLSFQQEGLWFIDQLEGSTHYHIPFVLKIKGSLDNQVLQCALQTIVDRHEVLHTVIRDEGGVGFQFIKEKEAFKLNITDGKIYKEDEQALSGFIRQAINKPFDLSKDDMMRADLIILDEEVKVLVITMHHIVSDGWSLSIFVKELAALYNAFVKNDPSPLMPLPIQYADYSIWQRNHFQGERMSKMLAYWIEKLKGVSHLQLPIDYTLPSELNSQGKVIRFNIDKITCVQLKQFSQQQGTTLYMTMLSVFNVLLHRYSNQNDICIGTIMATRQQKETEDLIGFFVNTLAFRTEVDPSAPFIQLMQQIKKTAIESYEYGQVPFEKVVEAVLPKRDLHRNPIFQVMFIWHNTPKIPEFQLGEALITQQTIEYDTAKFDLTFAFTETDQGLDGVVEYRTDLFKEATIERMIGHFKQLVTAVVAAPQQSIGTLPLLTPEEEHQLLVEFNNTAVAYPQDKTVVHLFEEQVTKTPDNIAVIYNQQKLTYRELNQKANQVAYLLKSKGALQQEIIPVFIERSLDVMVGILGILKAGCIYVPIDMDYPEERINYILKDIGAARAICCKEYKLKLEGIGIGFDIIELNQIWLTSDDHFLDNLQVQPEPSHLAYIIYTSGSTGKPKGAAVQHKSITNLLNWYIREFDINEEDKNIIISSPSFDLTQKNLFSPLLVGGTVIFPLMDYYDSYQIIKCIKEEAATIINCAPNAFYPLVTDNNSLSDLDSLRLVVLGGEPIHLEHISKWILSEGYRCEIVNSYGPTECTDIAAFFRMKKPAEYIHIPIPIGRPNDNVKLFVLSEFGQVQPISTSGEIYISGDSLGAGYLNRPELTREKFLPHPFSTDATERLYRTGDRGRWLEDGTLEYLGRLDDQVKIRGYRIEPGEIEGVLLQSGLVKEAVVVVQDQGSGNKQLVGYYVAGAGVDKSSLVSWLHARLPAYMVPALWVQLPRMPLTPNGKVDKKALPAPVQALSGNYEAPASDTEKALAQIWQEVLHLEQVGLHDNFFELGGHSLIVLQLANRIRNMGVPIELKDLFAHQTIEKQSNFLTTSFKLLHAASTGAFVMPIQPQGNNFPMFAFPDYLLYRSMGEHISKSQPLYSIERSPFSKKEEIVTHYIREIKKTFPNGPYYLAGFCEWGMTAIEIAHKLIEQGEKVPMIVLIECYSPKAMESRISMKFINSKMKFIFNKLNEKVPYSKKLKFIREEFSYGKHYIYNKFSKTNKNEKIYRSVLERRFNGKVVLVRASETHGYKDDPYMGWSDVFTGEIENITLKGSHLNIMLEPLAAQLAEKLNLILERTNKSFT